MKYQVETFGDLKLKFKYYDTADEIRIRFIASQIRTLKNEYLTGPYVTEISDAVYVILKTALSHNLITANQLGTYYNELTKWLDQ